MYKACVYEKITLEEFYRLIRVIDYVYLEDLKKIINSKETQGVSGYNLSLIGLTQLIPTHADIEAKSSEERMKFRLTYLGKILIKNLKEEQY